MDYRWVSEGGESPVHVENKSVNLTFAPDLGLSVNDTASSRVKHIHHPGFGLQHA